ncbi:hypothetical protein N39L_02590 [Limnospira platensis NIES-39]|jgi:hypothetical protein|uniref:Uncharacterized protein n=1 Tax=Limnospira platensis NIES-46 TaxID=1236695 RepID=A0A5M3T3X8_LIMPL|nr:hypothetical protein NIES39_A02770 [Arthrospira platensis NIES-39]BDT10536.1 hypothetical protein N39L_02590 [Arthrospira platensis NIES-39]GCE92591.1 hypothetical protein NIES46_06310 [Arthrospira platensis NIES-46]
MRQLPSIYKQIEPRTPFLYLPLPLTPSSVVYNDGSPKLGTEAEAILTAEIESSSGLLWRMIKYRRRIN